MSVKSISTPVPLKSGERSRTSSSSRQATIELRKFVELTESELSTWTDWQLQPEFHSPYFHPLFTACVDQVRDDVQIALVLLRDELVGIFPFQTARGTLMEPVGGAVNDYHGIISKPGRLPISQAELIQQCGISRFQFHSWIQHDRSVGPYVYDARDATLADMSHGFDEYLAEIRKSSSTIRRHPQKARKLMREVGPVRLELNCLDRCILDWNIKMKRERYGRTGVIDFFGVDWTRQLMHKIHQTQTPEFGGMLSALYAGDTLVATHFGMRCGSTLHYWYPVYDPQYQQYSPGTQLYLEIAKQAAASGITQIDFGYGDDLYKGKLINRRFQVARGRVDFNPLRRTLDRSWNRWVSRIKTSRLKEPVKKAVRMFAPGAGQPRV